MPSTIGARNSVMALLASYHPAKAPRLWRLQDIPRSIGEGFVGGAAGLGGPGIPESASVTEGGPCPIRGEGQQRNQLSIVELGSTGACLSSEGGTASSNRGGNGEDTGDVALPKVPCPQWGCLQLGWNQVGPRLDIKRLRPLTLGSRRLQSCRKPAKQHASA